MQQYILSRSGHNFSVAIIQEIVPKCLVCYCTCFARCCWYANAQCLCFYTNIGWQAHNTGEDKSVD